jgi:hypothetical protein
VRWPTARVRVRATLILYPVPPRRAAGGGGRAIPADAGAPALWRRARGRARGAHRPPAQPGAGGRALLGRPAGGARCGARLSLARLLVASTRVSNRLSGPVWLRHDDWLDASGLRPSLATEQRACTRLACGRCASAASPSAVRCAWASMRPWLCRPAPPPHQGRCMRCWERSVYSPVDHSAGAPDAHMHARAHCVRRTQRRTLYGTPGMPLRPTMTARPSQPARGAGQLRARPGGRGAGGRAGRGAGAARAGRVRGRGARGQRAQPVHAHAVGALRRSRRRRRAGAG